MEGLLEIGLSNAVAATAIALGVVVLGRLVRRPALVHALWLVVLLKLVTPPIVRVPLPDLALARLDVAPEIIPGEPVRVPLDRVETVELRSHEAPPPSGAVWSEPAIPEPRSAEIVVSAPTVVESLQASYPAPSRLRWLALLGQAWIAGSVLMTLLVTARVLRFRRLLRFCRPAPAGLEQEVGHLARRIGLRRPPRVCLMPGCVSPLVWGVGRSARLLFPEDLLGRLSEEGRAALLLHELAHLRRRDHWVRWFEVLVTALYWWHPLVWLSRRAIRDVEEQCCDAWVVWALPEGRSDYARALVQTIEFLSESRTPVPSIATGVGPVRTLRRRLRMIIRGTTQKSISLVGLLAIVLVAGLALPTLPSWGQSEADDGDQYKPKEVALEQSAPKSGEESDAAPVSSEDPFRGPGVPDKAASLKEKVAPPKVEFLPQPSDREQRIAEALEEPTTLEFEEESLEEVFQYLQDLHEIPIFIDRKELHDQGISVSEETVTVNLTTIKLQSGLRLLLDQLELFYLVEDNVLKITSAEKAQDTLISRVYLVGDLWSEPIDAEELVEAIKTTVSPKSWDPVGAGSIVPITKSRSLVVRQNYPVHEELLRFLRALRAANDLEGVAQADVDGLRLPDQFEERPEQRGADRAAGRIAYVSHRLGLVWIDRGDADGISSNQKFVVHSQAAEGNLGKKKAEIEVIGIRAPHLAEARIVNNVEAESEPIREGDLIEHFE